jgi:hypothetical protein
MEPEVQEAAFDAAIEEAVNEAPAEEVEEAQFSEPEDLATRRVPHEQIANFEEVAAAAEAPEAPAESPPAEAAEVAEFTPAAEAEDEVFEFEIAPEEENPPDEPGRQTLRQ